MLNYALREIGRRKKAYALNVLAIALVVLLIVCLNSISIAYGDASKLPFESIHSNIIIQKNGNVPENISGAVVSCSMAPITPDYVNMIKDVSGVKDVSSGLMLWVFDSDNFKRVMGVNWNDSFGAIVENEIVEGSMPKTDDEVLVEKFYSSQYGLEIGDRMMLSGSNFMISGIVETSGKDVVSSDVYANLVAIQHMAYSSENLQNTETVGSNDVNIIFVSADQTKIDEIVDRLDGILNPVPLENGTTPTGQTIGKFSVYTPHSFENQISSIFMLTNQLSLIISAIVVICASMIIVRNMGHTILERRKEIGIMKAVGFRNMDVSKEIATELSFQIIMGYFVGIILSFVAIAFLSMTTVSINIPWELNPYPHFLTQAPDQLNVVQTYMLPVSFQAGYALLALGIVFMLGMLSTFIIIKKINGLKVMEVLRHE